MRRNLDTSQYSYFMEGIASYLKLMMLRRSIFSFLRLTMVVSIQCTVNVPNESKTVDVFILTET